MHGIGAKRLEPVGLRIQSIPNWIRLGETKEIVRMPVALISQKYLRKAFDGSQINYFGEIQPSVKSDPIFEDDFVLFDWDIVRR